MPYFYKKILDCGCTILAFKSYAEEDNTYHLGAHQYHYICNECKSTFSEEVIEYRLEYIFRNDYKTSKSAPNDWVDIGFDLTGHFKCGAEGPVK